MKLKAHNFFTLLCLAVFGLSIFVVVSSKTGLLNGGTANRVNGATSAGKTASSKIFLEISQPQDGATIDDLSVFVKGKTLPRAEVFINEVETKANSQGNFSARITLDEGENLIYVLANDAEGNFLEKEITVIVESFE